MKQHAPRFLKLSFSLLKKLYESLRKLVWVRSLLYEQLRNRPKHRFSQNAKLQTRKHNKGAAPSKNNAFWRRAKIARFFAHREHHPHTPSLPYRISKAPLRYFSTLHPPAPPPKLKIGTLEVNYPTHSAPKFQLDPSRFGIFRIKTSFLMFFLRKMKKYSKTRKEN